MVVDVSGLQGWLALAAVAISVGTFIYNWFTSGSKSNAASIAKLKEDREKDTKAVNDRLDRHHSRIGKIENEMDHLPGAEAVHNLQLAISEMGGDLRVMAQSAAATSASVKRLEDWAFKTSGDKQ